MGKVKWLWPAAVALAAAILVLVSCQPAVRDSEVGPQTVPSIGAEAAVLPTEPPETQAEESDGAEQPALPNPASAFCEDAGHELEMREGEGGSYGVCLFADGSECEEWAYFRGECQPGDSESSPTATPESTSATATGADGWQIYENEVPAYRFLYPAEATIEPGHDPQQTVTVAGPLLEDEHWPIFYVGHPPDRAEYRPPEDVDLALWLVEQGLLAAEDEAQAAERRQAEREIGGETAVHTRFERSEQSYAYDKYFFARDGQLYTIVILHAGDREDWDLYNRFLDSFQFGPQAQAAQIFDNERYSLRYPADLSFFENERPSADGVLAPLPDSIALQGGDFLLAVTTFDVSPEITLEDFVDAHADCLEVSGSGGQPARLGNLEGRWYEDTLCGLTGISFFFGLHGSTGFRVAVETAGAYAAIQDEVQPLLDSLLAKDPGPSSKETRFDVYLPFARQEGSQAGLKGLLRENDGWEWTEVSLPPGVDPTTSDYAPATDRLLVWDFAGGAGPGSLAVGKLMIVDVETGSQEVVVPGNVVAAGWAPDGLDFAYILATPDTYELRWRAANGDDQLLAVDVPHSLRVSPDGRFVAFTRESHYGLTAVPGLTVVEIATGIETQVSDLDRAGYGGSGPFWKPQWSPDSSQLLLYTAADTDRAATPHEAGFVWAAVDGSFSHLLPDSSFLAQIDKPLSDPDAYRCLGSPVLIAANQMVLPAGECQPMSDSDPDRAQPAVFLLDAQTGTAELLHVLPVAEGSELLAWDVPGESVLLQGDGRIASYALEGIGP